MIQKIISLIVLLSFATSNSLTPEAAAQVSAVRYESSVGAIHEFPLQNVNKGAVPVFNGIKIFPDEPFRFDFIVADAGASADDSKEPSGDEEYLYDRGQPQKTGSPQEYLKLVKYFMASLTVPEGDLWVNLSPYEPDRIVPKALGQTEMGRDMLAQDYILKQLTASLMSPEGEAGEKLWDKIYSKIYEDYNSPQPPLYTKKGSAEFQQTGAVPVLQEIVPVSQQNVGSRRAMPETSGVPEDATHHAQRTTDQIISSFNKVWIVPDQVEVYQNGDVAYITKATLKVMLESDYLAQEKSDVGAHGRVPVQDDVKDIIRSTIIPLIEDEVNTGESFANLRQIFHSMILAKWYEQHFKSSILGQNYVDRNVVKGIELSFQNFMSSRRTPGPSIFPEDLTTQDTGSRIKSGMTVMEIYNQYLSAFKAGASNLIQEEYDPVTQSIVPRKYFVGGEMLAFDKFQSGESGDIRTNVFAQVVKIRVSDSAMMDGNNMEFYSLNLKDFKRVSKLDFTDPLVVLVKYANNESVLKRQRTLAERYSEKSNAYMQKRLVPEKGYFMVIDPQSSNLNDPIHKIEGQEPRDFDFNGDLLAIAFVNEVGLYRVNHLDGIEFLKIIKNDKFGLLHKVSFNTKDPNLLLIVSSGFDRIFEIDIRDNSIVWEFNPWEKGFNINKLGLEIREKNSHLYPENDKRVIAFEEAEKYMLNGKRLDGRYYEVSYENLNPYLGLQGWQIITYPNWADYDENGDVLATFFDLGDVVKISKDTKDVSFIDQDIERLHGMTLFRDGRMITDTKNSKVLLYDKFNKRNAEIIFSDMPVNSDSDSGYEWLQFSYAVNDDWIVSVDERRKKIIYWNPYRKEYCDISYPDSESIQMVGNFLKPYRSSLGSQEALFGRMQDSESKALNFDLENQAMMESDFDKRNRFFVLREETLENLRKLFLHFSKKNDLRSLEKILAIYRRHIGPGEEDGFKWFQLLILDNLIHERWDILQLLFLNSLKTGNAAVLNQAPGGIDLNHLNMQTSGKAAPILAGDSPLDSAMMNQPIQMLVPKIIGVGSVTLGVFLGLNTDHNSSDGPDSPTSPSPGLLAVKEDV